MDLMQKLQEVTPVLTRKRVDKWLIYALGLFGIVVVVMAGWLALSDLRQGGAASEARNEGRQAEQDLMRSVQALKRVMIDEQVQADRKSVV
jgi:hypothetical protein